MNTINDLKHELIHRSGTGELDVDQRVESLSNDLPKEVIESAFKVVHAWEPIFCDNHTRRVESLLARLELLGGKHNDRL